MNGKVCACGVQGEGLRLQTGEGCSSLLSTAQRPQSGDGPFSAPMPVGGQARAGLTSCHPASPQEPESQAWPADRMVRARVLEDGLSERGVLLHVPHLVLWPQGPHVVF